MLGLGLFEIDTEGMVWRTAKRHGRGVKPGGGYHRGAKTSPCKRVRAEWTSRAGYLVVSTTLNGKRLNSGAHRLVWTNGNGPIPPGLTINHKNGVKDDNRPENLELATYSQQRWHAINVNRNRPKGSKHPKTKLTEQDVLKIRQLRKDGMMVKDIAKRYEMRPNAISQICRRATWKHI